MAREFDLTTGNYFHGEGPGPLLQGGRWFPEWRLDADRQRQSDVTG